MKKGVSGLFDAGLNYDLYANYRELSGLEKCAFGILHTALKDLFGLVNKYTLEKDQTIEDVIQSAREYVFMEPQDYAMSFDSICDGLLMCPDNLRDGLRSILSDDEKTASFQKILATFDYRD